MSSKVWGYGRSSTDHQTVRAQLTALESSTPSPDKIFLDEGTTGKSLDRPEFRRMLDVAREGDLIVFYSLSRASRSTIDALTLLSALDERGILYRSLTETIDNTTPAGRAMTAMIAAFGALERETTVMRVRSGLESARRRGVVLGRKPKLSPQQHRFIRKLYDAGDTRVPQLAEEFKVSIRTVWRSLEITSKVDRVAA